MPLMQLLTLLCYFLVVFFFLVEEVNRQYMVTGYIKHISLIRKQRSTYISFHFITIILHVCFKRIWSFDWITTLQSWGITNYILFLKKNATFINTCASHNKITTVHWKTNKKLDITTYFIVVEYKRYYKNQFLISF